MALTLKDINEKKNQWKKLHKDTIMLLMNKGEKAIIQERAMQAGKTMSKYILDIVNEYERTKK